MALLALPFVLIVAIGGARLEAGTGWGLLPLMAVGPAMAAAIGGARYTLVAGAEALVISGLFLADIGPESPAHRPAVVALVAVAGVTVAGMVASTARRRRERELAQVRLVAEAAQQVLLPPVPRHAGPVRLAAKYLSASSEARVGGDLYEVTGTSGGVRLVVGDAEGKGLPAVRSAAALLRVFREAAHEEKSLTTIAARIETSLDRQLGDEEFITAIFAEVSADGSEMELLSCGHPAPLLLGSAPPRFVDTGPNSLPLGLGNLGCEPRTSVTIPFAPGEAMLFYTDGATEARNAAGEFFPLASSTSLRHLRRPDTLVDRLGKEVAQHVGHAPDDDVAFLVVYRD
jgi:serine phosphatase RsbU (regulator of sigma subunit)